MATIDAESVHSFEENFDSADNCSNMWLKRPLQFATNERNDPLTINYPTVWIRWWEAQEYEDELLLLTAVV